MTQSLAELRHNLEKDGWVPVGKGEQPWELRYERPLRAAADDPPKST